MSTSTEKDTLDAPDGWHWGLCERGRSYYDKWLYTDSVLYHEEDSTGSKFGCEIHIYHDSGNRHIVDLMPITRIKPGGDYEYGYEGPIGSFETEHAAEQAAIAAASSLR